MGAMISPVTHDHEERLPKPRRVSCSQQKQRSNRDIKSLDHRIRVTGAGGLSVFRKASRDAVIFRNNGLYGPMLGRFHRQVQGIRTVSSGIHLRGSMNFGPMMRA